MASGTYMFASQTTAAGYMYQDGAFDWGSTMSAQNIDSGTAAAFIGSLDGATKFLDGDLRTFQIWNRRVSLLEIDFAFQSLSPETDYETLGRAAMSREFWTDDTGTGSQEPDRLNQSSYAAHRYYRAQFPTGTIKRVQIAASINGVVTPDVDLGGKLFSLIAIEYPVGAPAVFQSSGWSSVFDVSIRDEGHYTWVVMREDGGGIFLHLDAEAV